MKDLGILLVILLNYSIVISQKYIDMTPELSNIKGNLIIDGNSLKLKHHTREEIIIRAKNLKFSNNSGMVLNNVILQLSGNIIVDDGAKIFPKIIDSYIFCRSSENLQSKRIIIKNNFKDVVNLSKVKYLKKIKGNPKVYLYNKAGKCKFKGLKSEMENKYLAVSRYDIKIEGPYKSFDSNILIY